MEVPEERVSETEDRKIEIIRSEQSFRDLWNNNFCFCFIGVIGVP